MKKIIAGAILLLFVAASGYAETVVFEDDGSVVHLGSECANRASWIGRHRKRRRKASRAEESQTYPACALAGRCGGCDWLHVSHAAQIGLKRGIVREALRRTGRIERDEAPLEPGLPFTYRNRVQLHRHPSGALGYREAAGHQVVAAAACPVAVEPINALLADPPDPGGVTTTGRR
jgi:tRNA/tmRNA/rRNA uracil-C5-methylase (TrmA/RlmC/RlmD family)